MSRSLSTILAGGLFLLGSFGALGGGSGLNVFLVANERSANSLEVANYYRVAREIPPGNFLKIDWPGGATSWSLPDFESTLRQPLLEALFERGLTDQITCVVLSMDIPYRVSSTNGVNSTTAALFYGFKPDATGSIPSCSLPNSSASLYQHTERSFEPSEAAVDEKFLVMMLTSASVADAKRIIDRAVESDGGFPTSPIVLAKTSDAMRNIRFLSSDNALFNSQLLGRPTVQLRAGNSIDSTTALAGLQTGVAAFVLPTDLFVPGALADSLTSFGGYLFESTGQTSLLAFLKCGAAGSYGTVVEPCNYLQKFPDPQIYFYQGRGFNAAESFYLSVTNPYQGLVVGEPLAAPFRRSLAGQWIVPEDSSIVRGAIPLSIEVGSSSAEDPVQQVDIFLDGTFALTLTNIVAQPGNQLQLVLKGRTINYSIPAESTAASITEGLASVLNRPSILRLTSAEATAHGDRLELQGTDMRTTPDLLTVAATADPGTASYQTTFLKAAGSGFQNSPARGFRDFNFSGVAASNDVLKLEVTLANEAAALTFSVTNRGSNTALLPLLDQMFREVQQSTALLGPAGLQPEDLVSQTATKASLALRARTPGWAASQIRTTWTVPSGITVVPNSAAALDKNLNDLRLRAHVYVTIGLTQLVATGELNTALWPDGRHELVAVAYEGTHVRSQTHFKRLIEIRNQNIQARLTLPLGQTKAAVESSIPVSVEVTGTDTAQVEIEIPGGQITATALQAISPIFGATSTGLTAYTVIPGTQLGIGTHSLRARVWVGGRVQVLTDPVTLTLLGPQERIELNWDLADVLRLRWNGVAGRAYEILAATNPSGPFQVQERLVAETTATTDWTSGALGDFPQRFYRVRVAP